MTDPHDRYSRAAFLKDQSTQLIDAHSDADGFDDYEPQTRRPKKSKRQAFQHLDLIDENLDLLPEQSRDTILLLLRGHSVAYVAKQMDISPAAVEKIVKSARRIFSK